MGFGKGAFPLVTTSNFILGFSERILQSWATFSLCSRKSILGVFWVDSNILGGLVGEVVGLDVNEEGRVT